jgi:hypothetical protein
MIGTVEQFQAWAAAKGITVPSDEAILTLELEAASSRLAALCFRRLEPLENAAELVPGTGTAVLPISEFIEVDGVRLYGWETDLNPDAYWTQPQEAGPVTSLRYKLGHWPQDVPIMVTGTLGYQDPVPSDLVVATYTLTAFAFSGSNPGVKEVNVLGVSVKFDTAEFEKSLLSAVASHVKRV